MVDKKVQGFSDKILKNRVVENDSRSVVGQLLDRTACEETLHVDPVHFVALWDNTPTHASLELQGVLEQVVKLSDVFV